MCGFVGFTTGELSQDENETLIREMASKIAHRGPDDEGYYVNDSVAMGFRRLSIIDIAKSHQPMSSSDGRVNITFNGEIYNFRELREELVAAGHTFVTDGDTETLVHGYEQWGTGMFERLRGMFALAIWDAEKEQLVFARDIFGIKPMYHYRFDGGIMWGSEIKAFLPHPSFKKEFNEDRLPEYLCFEYLNDDQTLFRGVQKLLPGHYAIYTKDGGLKTASYYRITYHIDENTSLEDWAERICEKFTESSKAHAIADVQVGAFLSGGVDSAVVTCTLGKSDPDVQTFTAAYDLRGIEDLCKDVEGIGANIKLDEADDAKGIAESLNLKNEIARISSTDFLDSVPNVQYMMDEPLGAPSAIPLYFVSALAAKNVKVVQSGEGADELFGGYWIYHDQLEFSGYYRVPRFLRGLGGAVAEKLPAFHGRHFAMRGSGGPEKSYQRATMNYMWDEVPHVLKKKTSVKPWTKVAPYFRRAEQDGLDVVTQAEYVDMHTYLPFDICLKADRMSMAHSLELRVPFLDKELLDLALQLPTKYRMTDEESKVALRRAASKMGLFKEAAERPKQPFITPLTAWLQTDEYYDRIKRAFTGEAAERFFDTQYLMKMLDNHHSADFTTVEGRGKLGMMRIWNVYSFLCWYEVFFGDTLKTKATA